MVDEGRHNISVTGFRGGPIEDLRLYISLIFDIFYCGGFLASLVGDKSVIYNSYLFICTVYLSSQQVRHYGMAEKI